MQSKKKGYRVRIDIGRLLIGLLLGICLMFTIGVSSNNSERYQCCAAGDDSLAVFVIDTQTGQVWRLSRTDTYDFGTPTSRKSTRKSETPVHQ